MGTYYDQVAKHYDDSRYLTPGVARQAADWFKNRAGLTQASTVLEAGIGTGNNVLPLVQDGLYVTGTDVSVPMLEQAREKAGKRSNLQLLIHGANTLPFLDRSFDMVLTVHVLHTVESWKVLMQSFGRVLRPEGMYFYGEYLLPPHRREFENLYQTIVAQQRPESVTEAKPGREAPEAPSRENVRRFLEQQGAQPEESQVARWEVTNTVSELLSWYEARSFGSCWGVPDTAYPELMQALRVRCQEQYGSLNATLSSAAVYNVLCTKAWENTGTF